MSKRINQNTKVSYSAKEIRQMKQRERTKGLQEAINIMQLIPLLTLRDLEGYGQARMLRYIEKYKQVSAAYFDDDITLQDIVDVLKDEVKIDLEELIK